MSDNDDFNRPNDDLIPRSRQREEAAARTRQRDDPERQERDRDEVRGPDQLDPREMEINALHDLLATGASADPTSREGRLWRQINQMAANALNGAPGTSGSNDVVQPPISPISMIEKIEKPKDPKSISYKLDMTDSSYQVWSLYVQTSLQGLVHCQWLVFASSTVFLYRSDQRN